MKTQGKGIPRNRAPKGVDSVHRINIALMPDEREELLRRAASDGRTTGAMARMFLLRGMQAACVERAES